ncbi:Membrane associated serine protease, rhomboid family [Austwickia chelonae]|uniref:Putative peptidase n=1 Tax=Austwickia chelonae NBRC 105200 TaxID=1184607 RepID=K6UNM1_9MICO|nr:putative peptidase [Austwickia chelonae NBRC 105200]SEW42158.1 Membrane associated serine protease, rhomboid family [Austwickia chelonae]
MTTPYGAPSPVSGPMCPRHQGVLTYVTCQRCGRPVCPRCQVPASVGVHCVDCSAESRRNRPAAVRRALSAEAAPYVTYGFTAVICVVYVVQLLVPSLTLQMALVPLLTWREPWRLLTSALVHDPNFPLHLVGNALLLVLLGRVVEPALGHLRYAVMCVLSALGGSVAIVWMSAPPDNPMTRDLSWVTPVLGSSAIGYGLMCALLVREMRGRGDVRGVTVLIVLNVAFSLMMPNVSWQGHLGGAVAGAVATWLLSAVGSPLRPKALAWAVGGVGSLLMVGAVVARFAVISPYWGGFSG